MDITPYTGLITSAHADKPRFTALVAALVQPLADIQSLVGSLPGAFDLDAAVGQQLDMVGQWVGVTRNLKTPITGVFFSFDTAGVGFDQGIWWTPYTPSDGLEALPDEQYRLLLRARILDNNWDGSLAQAYAIYDALFADSPYTPFIEDYGNLSMAIGLAGQVPDALTLAMLTQGLLNARPAGVRITYYYTSSANAPIFAFDISNSIFAGFDTGAWALPHTPA